MNCLNAKAVLPNPIKDHEAVKDEELDLENLIMNSDDEDFDRQSEGFNNSATSDESTTSLDNPISNHCVNGNEKASSNGKRFLKSLPMAILSGKKLFGSHSDLSHQRSSPPSVMPVQLSSSIPQAETSPFKQVKSQVVERAPSKSNVSCQQMSWSVWITDSNMYRDIELPYDAACSLLLHMLLLKLERPLDLTSWSIVLHNSEFLLERIIEDHEVLVDVKDSWPAESITRLCLNRTPTKFEILQNPESSLPQGMLTIPPSSAPLIMEPTESKRKRMQSVLTTTAPEFCGWLHTRDSGSRCWKKNFCVLRNSGLYCSTKGESKEPRHLRYFADVLPSSVWVSSQNKKYDSSSHCFCLKDKATQEMKWLSADSLFELRAWVNAIRLIINGNRFHESFLNARRRGTTVFTRLKNSVPQLSSSEDNLVAMDFSGNRGRVISDPNEVAMMELEQQTSWRKKIIRNHHVHHEYHSSAPTNGMAWIARSIHQTQSWFFGKIPREDAVEVLQRQGLVEGSYLVRDSHRIPGSFVITICHNQKIKHIPISQIDNDGQLCFSLDNGETRFSDLIQVVDFHRLNRGNLPCKLQHEAMNGYS